ncbi:MAG TPA: GNAT family N-acetyltransferase [bacterium]|nr:GNAT family N-acetyltransferase [bacterium]
MRELETSRLLIRSFTTIDLDVFARLMDASFGGPTDLEHHRERVLYYVLAEKVAARLHQPPYGDRAIVLKDTGRLIGSVGFVPCLAPFGQLPSFGGGQGSKFSPEVGLFYAVLPEYRGRGMASEAAGAMIRFAFNHLNLRRIVATTEYDNAASAAVMRRIGMTIQHNPWPLPQWFQVVGVLENVEGEHLGPS